ncbi:MAG: NUDIX domain-containing protein [Kiritimatiellae bacterium]|nr:NUDIX domain-containing protein [Kiritimatiellia bacterium]
MMDEETGVEVLARGVCVKAGQILLCKSRTATICYLPGGHVEFRETARYALEREIREEMGLSSRAGAFLGCCEHSFIQKGRPHAEINLVFGLDVPDADPAQVPVSREDWIEFFWWPIGRLREAHLEPAPFCEALETWLRQPGGHFVSGKEWIGDD